MKPLVPAAGPELPVLFGFAEQGTEHQPMPEPLDAIEGDRHHEGDERHEAEADRPAEDGEQAIGEEGEEEGHHPEAGEDFDGRRAFRHLLTPSSRKTGVGSRCLLGAASSPPADRNLTYLTRDKAGEFR